MDLKDLDEAIQGKLQNIHKSTDKILKMVNLALKVDTEKLSPKEKAELYLFISYASNGLYWMYLREIGEDPNNQHIKDQFERVKSAMLKLKQDYERQTIRPRLDQAAAKRFVRHGIHYKDDTAPPNKKIKFDN